MLSAWILIASDCNHSVLSFLRVPTIAAVGLASIISAMIFPSLIARVLPSLLSLLEGLVLLLDVLAALGGCDLVVGDGLVKIVCHGFQRLLMESGNLSE